MERKCSTSEGGGSGNPWIDAPSTRAWNGRFGDGATLDEAQQSRWSEPPEIARGSADMDFQSA